MPNPNSINFSQTPNQAPTNTEVSRTRTENQSTGQKPNRAVEQEGNRFLHISREELLKVDPANLLPSERQDFIDAHQAWIDKYQKIIDAAKEKEAALATEAEAASVAEAETTSTAENETATPAADLSGLDVINADQESVDRITPEALAATKEKAKQKLSLKEVFAKKVLPVVLSAAILISGIVGLNAIGKDNGNQAEDNSTTPPTEQTDGSYGSYDEYAAAGEQHEQHGIKDGYYDPGRYASPNKSTAVDFAYAPEVAENIGSNDAREIAIAVADSEVEAMAQQIAAMPDEVKAHYGLADFKGLGWKAVEQKLEKMNDSSPDLFDSISQCYHNAMKDSQYSIDHISGSVVNGYIQHNGEGRYAHGNMEGVQCTTQEDGTSVAKFAWPKLSSEDMMMKIQYDEQGKVTGGCTQIIFLEGSAKAILVMDGVPSIIDLPSNSPSNPDNPDTPDTSDTPDTPNVPQSKNQEEADENSGADAGIVTPEKQERQITNEPEPDKAHGYNQETNTYDYTPAEQAANIGYEVTNDINEVGQESSSITSPDEVAAAEEMVSNQTAPEMVTGTREGVDAANDFDAGATVGTGEVTGDTQSADDSGNTIQENLDNATGNQTANPTGDYSQGF